ncbi:alkaline phosphatase [Gammaproteobacteria bacterium]|nr:alkaline phosphatase [Gammaproteobacteria bacterium]MDC0090562.1 alkaline phosphatase [Gammaproteobacteria bacterium]
MKKYLLLFGVVILTSCQDGTVVEEAVLIGTKTNATETLGQNPNIKAKNIILLIGDGMGPNQVALARFSVGGANHRLSFENFPVTGIVLNHSADNLYTDSAAAATAWATGIKTKNGYLSVDSDNKFLPTIPELLSTKGYLTGLVATSSITHATPAAFYAHIKSRSKHKQIAQMLVESDIAIALGGGSEFFKLPTSNPAIHIIDTGNSLDQDNLVQHARVLGLFGEDGLDRRLSPPTQLQMTERALDFLDSKTSNCAGFFLMSEGSQIDWAGHDNNVKYMLTEFADFDDSVASAIEFSKQNKETLILVTADHATGGLVLQKPRSSSIRAQWTTTSHDLSPINIYAYGPGAEKFSGVMDNTEIFDRMLQALDYENLDSNNCVD